MAPGVMIHILRCTYRSTLGRVATARRAVVFACRILSRVCTGGTVERSVWIRVQVAVECGTVDAKCVIELYDMAYAEKPSLPPHHTHALSGYAYGFLPYIPIRSFTVL